MPSYGWFFEELHGRERVAPGKLLYCIQSMPPGAFSGAITDVTFSFIRGFSSDCEQGEPTTCQLRLKKPLQCVGMGSISLFHSFVMAFCGIQKGTYDGSESTMSSLIQ